MKVVRGSMKPPRVVLYGPPGIGKSTFGSQADKPIFVPTEDGIDNVPVDQMEKSATWTDVLARLDEIGNEKHGYKTVVLDTVNAAVDLAAKHVCKELYDGQWAAKKGDGGFMGWGQGWRATAEEIRNLLSRLDTLRARGMMVILLAHAGTITVKSPIEGEYTRFAPEMDKSCWARICAWSDIVIRADYEYTVLHKKDGDKGRAIGNSTRWLYCVGSAACDAKTRVGYDLPEKMELSYAAFAEALGHGGAVLDELLALWPSVPKANQAKALAWLGVQKIEDAPTDKAKIVLNRIRQTEAEKETK